MQELKKWKRGGLILTATVMLLGICLVIWPGISAEILCCLFGGVLLIVGAIRLLCYFRQRGINVLWRRYELPIGLLDGLFGVYFFTRPANVLTILPIVAGIAILVDSVFKLQTALELREMNIVRWRSILIFAIAGILAGIFLVRNPFEGTVTLMRFVGISLMIDGIQNLFFIRDAAKEIRRQAPVETTYTEVE